jgi:hypothetical protein
MYRKMLLAAGVAFFFASPSLAATPCKDAHGKFIKCPPAAAKPTPAPVATPTPKPSPTAATRCKDAKGKFIKCAPAPTPKPAPSAGKCRNAKGQFAKCGTPGAKPA